MSDRKSFQITNVVKQFSQKLFAFVRGKVKTNEDAEDILQDVWYQFSNLANIDDLENAGAWLYRVARNRVTDKYRKKKTELIDDFSYENDDTEESESGFQQMLLLDAGEDPELSLFKENFWEEMMIALEELPAKQREVFILNEIEDLTLQEIADKTGENLKTIISRKGYAVKYLRKKLDGIYKELND